MFKKFFNNPVHLLLNAGIISLMILTFFPASVFATATQYTVRFTASYKSGSGGTKNVYYILDNGSATLLGSVSNSNKGDFTFTPSFSDSVRVYVEINDNTLYSEALYINSNLVSSGDLGNGGLTYSRSDSTPPSGKITSPVSGATVTQCPLFISANVTDDNSGVAWVAYNVFYDNAWHTVATDNNSSGTAGWSTNWDCSQVSDQSLKLEISAQDNSGNNANNLGGVVTFTLAKGAVSTATSIPGIIPNTSSAGQSLAQSLSTRFNLNQSDVQTYVTSFIQQRQKSLYDRLVSEGKITSAQETAIIAELTSVKSQFNADAMDNNLTSDQWLKSTQDELNTLITWAKTQGINPIYVVTFGGLGAYDPLLTPTPTPTP